MKINGITINGYRNLTSQSISLCDNLNVFFGANAQGKTNLLESVYLCCLAKSPRTDKDGDLIRWNEQKAEIRCNFDARYGNSEIEIALNKGSSKKIKVNGNALSKTSQLLGRLNCVYFSPQEIKIVSQTPQDRRRFLDVDLCQLDKSYFFALSRFNKVLQQRNNLLKSDIPREEMKKQITVWDTQLAVQGAILTYKRREFCAQLQPLALDAHLKLSAQKEKLKIGYSGQIKGSNESDLYEDYLRQLTEGFDKDFEKRYTVCGCQRDDILLSINGVNVKSFGSCGQQRSAALALKLAETELFRRRTGEYPVLLLDDVLSELDVDRQKALLDFSQNIQVLLTSAVPLTQKELAGNKYRIFKIVNGEVINGNDF